MSWSLPEIETMLSADPTVLWYRVFAATYHVYAHQVIDGHLVTKRYDITPEGVSKGVDYNA